MHLILLFLCFYTHTPPFLFLSLFPISVYHTLCRSPLKYISTPLFFPLPSILLSLLFPPSSTPLPPHFHTSLLPSLLLPPDLANLLIPPHLYTSSTIIQNPLLFHSTPLYTSTHPYFLPFFFLPI